MRVIRCAVIFCALLSSSAFANNIGIDYGAALGGDSLVEINKETVKAFAADKSLEAKAWHALVNKQYDAAAELFAKQLRHTAGKPSAMFGLAVSWQKAGNVERAKQAYDLMLDKLKTPTKMRGFAMLNRAILEPQADFALDIFRHVPSSVPAHMTFAAKSYVYAGRGDIDNARRAMDTALDGNPNNLYYLYNKAILADQAGDKMAAIKGYDKILNQFATSRSKLGNRTMQSIAKRQEWLKSTTASYAQK